jgi:hypothetical protein
MTLKKELMNISLKILEIPCADINKFNLFKNIFLIFEKKNLKSNFDFFKSFIVVMPSHGDKTNKKSKTNL